jgi:hypothetical protein
MVIIMARESIWVIKMLQRDGSARARVLVAAIGLLGYGTWRIVQGVVDTERARS